MADEARSQPSQLSREERIKEKRRKQEEDRERYVGKGRTARKQSSALVDQPAVILVAVGKGGRFRAPCGTLALDPCVGFAIYSGSDDEGHYWYVGHIDCDIDVYRSGSGRDPEFQLAEGREAIVASQARQLMKGLAAKYNWSPTKACICGGGLNQHRASRATLRGLQNYFSEDLQLPLTRVSILKSSGFIANADDCVPCNQSPDATMENGDDDLRIDLNAEQNILSNPLGGIQSNKPGKEEED